MRLTIKGLHTVKAKGRVYIYAWRGGPRLHATPGTPAFLAELAATAPAPFRVDRTIIRGLIALWRSSEAWEAMSEGTRRNWSPWLDKIEVAFGEKPVASFDLPGCVPHIAKWRAAYSKTPRTADMAVQAFSRLFRFAQEEGLLKDNPCSKVPRLYKGDRSDLIWTADDLAELHKVAASPIYLAATLAALTGLRKSDLLRLSWSHVSANAIEIATGKSGGRKTTLIPIYGELRAALDAIPKRSTLVLTTTTGRAWGSGFNAAWNKAKIKAGLERLHFHDLRGTAATRFYLGGLSIRVIAEIMTWSEDRVSRLLDKYVKRDELILASIRTLDENEKSLSAVKPAVKP